MIFYTGVATVTILLALFVNNKCEKKIYGFSRQQVLNAICLFSVFLILFAVSALRLNVGNDYAKYVEYFHLIRCKLDTDTVVPTEPGFNLVCLLIYLISGRYENYLLMFAFFAFVTIFLFLKAMYEQTDNFPFTFFIFMCFGFYFQTFSTVRYYFALALALYAIPFVLRKEWVKLIIITAFGATFHKSMIIILPLYFLAQWSYKKWQLLLGAVFVSSFFFFQDIYMDIFLKVYPTYEETEYLDAGTSYINIIRCAAIFILSLILYKKSIKDNRTMMFYYYCNLGALILYVCCGFLPVISRIGYYLTITHIFFIPALVNGIENKKIKRIVMCGIIFALLVYFAIFIRYKAPSPGLRILPYQTFLFHDMVNILSDVS